MEEKGGDEGRAWRAGESSQMKSSREGNDLIWSPYFFLRLIFEVHVCAWEMDFNIRQGLLGTRQVWQGTGREVLPELALLVSRLPGLVFLMKGLFHLNDIRNPWIPCCCKTFKQHRERAESPFEKWTVNQWQRREFEHNLEMCFKMTNAHYFRLGSFPPRNLSWRHGLMAGTRSAQILLIAVVLVMAIN